MIVGFYSRFIFSLLESRLHTRDMNYLVLGTTFFFAVLITGCHKKQAACYDEALKKSTETVRCSSDCPGIKGCDGNFYCNECVAAMSGIRPE
jgi:hypothetical protein